MNSEKQTCGGLLFGQMFEVTFYRLIPIRVFTDTEYRYIEYFWYVKFDQQKKVRKQFGLFFLPQMMIHRWVKLPKQYIAHYSWERLSQIDLFLFCFLPSVLVSGIGSLHENLIS